MYDNSFLPVILISFNLFWAKLERSGKISLISYEYLYLCMHRYFLIHLSFFPPLSVKERRE